MKFSFVFWDVLPCKIIVDRRFRGTMIALMMEAARTYETSVDNYFTRQYIPEDKSELFSGQWSPTDSSDHKLEESESC
jgi:hypothetical protein